MIWSSHKTGFLERIARTGFLVSVGSYVLFWVFDLIEPGFVSRYFSVHIFLLSSIIFGLIWGVAVDEYTSRPWIESFVAFVLGVLLAVITWSVSDGLEGYRLVLVPIALITPSVIYVLIRD